MLLSVLIASAKTLSIHPRYSVHFPVSYLPGRGADMAASRVRRRNTAAVPVGISQRAPLSLTETMKTDSFVTAEHCSSPNTVTPAKCAPVELSLISCSMWPVRRTVSFSLSVWLCVESEVEMTASSHSRHHSLSSLSTTDVDLSAAGVL